MANWINDIQGLKDFVAGATEQDRRHILQMNGESETTSDRHILFPSAPVSIGGTDTSSTLESVIALLVALGLATDDR